MNLPALLLISLSAFSAPCSLMKATAFFTIAWASSLVADAPANKGPLATALTANAHATSLAIRAIMTPSPTQEAAVVLHRVPVDLGAAHVRFVLTEVVGKKGHCRVRICMAFAFR